MTATDRDIPWGAAEIAAHRGIAVSSVYQAAWRGQLPAADGGTAKRRWWWRSTILAADLADALNAWRPSGEGSDIWQEVILPSGAYDETATEALDGVQANDRFVAAGGRVVRYDPQTRTWILHGREDR